MRENQVQLQYFRVDRATAGVVGDIPVRVGDRVKTDTVLTTIDQNAGLEVYVQVPIERAPDLRRGLPVRLVDSQGQAVAESAIDFVSPQVDDRTQSILAKAPVPTGKGFRTEQFVRAQVVWREEPGLTVPAVAVTRINGQYFAFVAEPAAKGSSPVSDRCSSAISSATTTSSSSGLKAGRSPHRVRRPEDRATAPPSSSRKASPPVASARCSSTSSSAVRFSRLSSRCVIILAGAASIPTLPIAQYPELAPPQVSVTAIYTGANAQAVEIGGHHPDRAGHQRRRGHAVHDLDQHEQRRQHGHGDLQRRPQPGPGRRRRAEPRLDRARPPAQRGQEHRRHRDEGVRPASSWPPASTRRTAQYDSLFMSNYLDVFVRDALKRVPGVADVIIFGERKYAMRLWLDPTRLASRGLTAADVTARAARAERAGRGRRRRPAARRRRGSSIRSACAPPAGSRTQRVREHHRQGRHRRHARSG